MFCTEQPAAIGTPDQQVNLDIKLDDVIYRAEGHSSLVIALKSLDKVIRLPKVSESPCERNDIDLDELKRSLLNEIEFTWNVMGKLFKPNIWLNRYSLVRLSKQQMIEIRNKIEHSRLDYRKVRTLPPIDYFGLLIDDYCSFQVEQLKVIRNEFPNFATTGPVYSIEIKPKQGFISKESADLNICKFRLKQQEKLKHSIIKKVSTYCPLDLFSGDESRMKFALNSLIDSPQNNFRLFVDKMHVELESQTNLKFKENRLDQDELLDLLIFALNHPFSAEKEQIENTPIEPSICRYHFDMHKLSSANQLVFNSILRSILDVQRLDQIGSDRANQLYNLLRNSHRSSFDEWKNELKNSTELINIYDEQINESDQIRRELTKFFYSLTAKDCSILITFQKVLNIPHVQSAIDGCEGQKFHASRLCIYRTENSVFLFTLALIDLGRKHSKKVNTKFSSDKIRINEFLESNHS